MTEEEVIDAIGERWPSGDDRYDDRDRETLRLATEAVGAFPRSPKLLCIWGDLNRLVENRLIEGPDSVLDASLRAYEKAAALDPSFAEAWESIGYFLDVHAGDLAGAEAAFSRAVDLGGGDDSVIGLARTRAELGYPIAEILAMLDARPFDDDHKRAAIRDDIESGLYDPIEPD